MSEPEWTYQRDRDEKRLESIEAEQEYLRREHPGHPRALDEHSGRRIVEALERCGYRLVAADGE
jgi:hypothetical protein